MVIRISSLLLGCCVMGSPAWSEEGVVIEEAIYGDFEKRATTDVTEIVANQVKEGAVRLEAENGLLGDPAEGWSKKLQVRYRFQGEPSELTINEGETLCRVRKVNERRG